MTIRIANYIVYRGVTYHSGDVVTLAEADERTLVNVGYAQYVAGGTTPTAPTTPTGLTATPASSAAIALTWTASTDNTGTPPTYRVYRSGVLLGVATSTAYTDLGAQRGVTYAYSVVALGSTGLTSAPSAGATATIPSGGGGGGGDALLLEAVVLHDGTWGGGVRPSGYARVRWVNPAGTAYTRPGNMQAGDVWEHT